MLDGVKVYWHFSRPFTLLLPAMGMASGSLAAWGAEPRWSSDWTDGGTGLAGRILVGMVVGALLNVFSNGCNQIYDLEIDRINKPERMLPSGRLNRRQAWLISLLGLAGSLISAGGLGRQTLALAMTAALATWVYSAPPLRTKARGLWANLTIALPRGTLLWVAGWSVTKSAWRAEPWLVGLVLGLFFFGAATTKDFSDMAGDQAGGCRTLPIMWGIEKTIRRIGWLFVFPFLLLALLGLTGLLGGAAWVFVLTGLLASGWGLFIVFLLKKTSAESWSLTGSRSITWENHAGWRHMYWLSLFVQVALVGAYWA
ncbi:MAG TPA: UbiA family prenyltransferase [Acidobacteriota bacterium]|jgi:4-hydroxybenzoate polyprenyltransferase|nr:UbiA family prenyltransferase [Acidobacteriota bacterium]